MIKEIQTRVTPKDASSDELLIKLLCKQNGIDPRAVKAIRVLKRSIDARQRAILINIKAALYIQEEPKDEPFVKIEFKDVREARQAIIVGAGPAGLFAALRLIELGVKPIIVERGKNVRDRKKDLAQIRSEERRVGKEC